MHILAPANCRLWDGFTCTKQGALSIRGEVAVLGRTSGLPERGSYWVPFWACTGTFGTDDRKMSKIQHFL